MTKKKYPNLTKSEALSLSWKNRKEYKGYDKAKGSMYNSWRSKIYTEKGKTIGFPDKWKTFDGFIEDMGYGWRQGSVLRRIDNTKPYSKQNCVWDIKGSENLNRSIKLEYKGETKYLFEWSEIFNLNLNGVVQRYHKSKNYTKEEILFGKIKKSTRKVKDVKELGNDREVRAKLSKMLSSYKNQDLKRNREFNLDRKFLLEIIQKECVYCSSKNKIGVDRMDNNIGHLKSNCVPCCYRCNITRSDNFSFEEMKIIGRTIKLIDKKRNNE